MPALRYRLWRRTPPRARRWLVRRGTPTYTLGAIAVIERPDTGHVLLVRLSYRRAWGLPGGLLGRGEQPAAAVVREVAEEVGLPVTLLGPPTVVVDARARRGDIVFRCAPAPGADPDDVAARSPELVEARWWPVDGLPGLHAEAAAALRAVGHRVPPAAPPPTGR
jgi:ADP-ribose pyrophosphatase YjhB (NUDIX family)